jgi:hypothetical protein
MGKRPRVPHFITGIGDGNVNLADVRAAGRYNGIPNEDSATLKVNTNKDVNTYGTGSTNNVGLTATNSNHNRSHGNNSKNNDNNNNNNNNNNVPQNYYNPHLIRVPDERLTRMEEPPMAAVEHWRDMFGGSANGAAGGVGVGGRPTSPDTTGPWEVSALGLLGIIVIISAIFLHLVAEAKWGGHSSSSDHNHYHSPYHARRRRRKPAPPYKELKKKTDEWSEDEEEDNICNNEDADHTILVPLSGQDPPILTTADAAGSTMVVGDPASISGDKMGGVGGTALSTTPNRSNTSSSAMGSGGMANVASSGRTAYPYYYQTSSTTPQATHFHYGAPAPPPQQEHRQRKVSSHKEPSTPPPHMATTTTYDYYNIIPPSHPHSGIVPKYFSPSSKLNQRSPHPAGPSNATTMKVAMAAAGGVAMARRPSATSSGGAGAPSPRGGAPSSQGRLRLATPPEPMDLPGIMIMVGTPTSGHSSSTSTTSGGPLSQQYHHHQQQPVQRLLPTPHEESQLLMPSVSTEARHGSTGLNARLLSGGSDISSFNSFVEGSVGPDSEEVMRGDNGGQDAERRPHKNSPHDSSSMIMVPSSEHSLSYDHLSSNMSQRRESHSSSVGSGSRHHHSSLSLTPGNGFDETPRVGNRRMLQLDQLGTKLNKQQHQQQQHHISMGDTATIDNNDNNKDAKCSDDLDGLASFLQSDTPLIPFIPTLESSMHKQQHHLSGRSTPPRSILMDELKLIQMETGSSMHWGRDESKNWGTSALPSPPTSESFAGEGEDSSSYASDISIPSDDPRKSVIHKRPDLTQATDSASALQSSIQFSELQFEDVIGGGGFGQVWKAIWRGTPVAVKVLTGSAQAKHIPKAVLEEFRAEINLLKVRRINASLLGLHEYRAWD